MFSYEPGAGAVARIADGMDTLLSLDQAERSSLRRTLADFVAGEWTWERTALKLLAAAQPGRDRPRPGRDL